MPEEFILLDWLPLLLAIVGLIGGAIIYQIQKATDRKNQILQERRQLYRLFVNAVQKLQLNQRMKAEKEAIENFQKFQLIQAELFVTAPDNVVEKLEDLEKAAVNLMRSAFSEISEPVFTGSAESTDVSQAFARAFGAVIEQMRKDSFGNTEIAASAIDILTATSSIALGIRR